MANQDNFLTEVKIKVPDRNMFDKSRDHKTTCNFGDLVPVDVQEVLPGDRWHRRQESLCRMAPMLAPLMHRCDVFFHDFFVPNRITWENWEPWITQQPIDPNGAPYYPAAPYVKIGTGQLAYAKILDWMGVPTPIGANVETINALPLAAFQLIWDQYYRDQNLQTSININPNGRPFLIDGDNTTLTLYDGAPLTQQRYRCWEADLFTKALPWAQKGDPVVLPLGTFNDVYVARDIAAPPTFTQIDSPNTAQINVPNSPSPDIEGDALYASTSNLIAQAATINDLRLAFATQEFLEKQARGGTRYTEWLRSHFGVTAQDARLQRPEYIGGSKTPIKISEVLNTAGNEPLDLPQGNMAGHGISYTNGGSHVYYAPEHGFIITIMSIMPKTAYQQGLEKFWLKYQDPFQIYTPSFARIGEQPITNREIYAFQGSTGDATFGYLPAFYDYRISQNRVSGEFKDSMAFWHLGRIFAAPPALNEEFVVADDVRTDIFAAAGEPDYLWCHILCINHVSRLMPVFATPATF